MRGIKNIGDVSLTTGHLLEFLSKDVTPNLNFRYYRYEYAYRSYNTDSATPHSSRSRVPPSPKIREKAKVLAVDLRFSANTIYCDNFALANRNISFEIFRTLNEIYANFFN